VEKLFTSPSRRSHNIHSSRRPSRRPNRRMLDGLLRVELMQTGLELLQ